LLQLLCDFLDGVSLDDIPGLIIRVIHKPDTAFEARPHFVHIVLEALQRSDLPLKLVPLAAQQPYAGFAWDPAVGHHATRDEALAHLENLFDFGMSDGHL